MTPHSNIKNLFTRNFASIATNTQPVSSAVPTSKKSRLKRPTLTLDQFIQRQRVLSFWREIIRAVYKLRDYARNEFQRNKGVEDAAHIRYLLSAGKTEFDTMRRYIDELASR